MNRFRMNINESFHSKTKPLFMPNRVAEIMFKISYYFVDIKAF